ncbi:MAG: hypothetical protein R3F60_18170 [bacterium]
MRTPLLLACLVALSACGRDATPADDAEDATRRADAAPTDAAPPDDGGPGEPDQGPLDDGTICLAGDCGAPPPDVVCPDGTTRSPVCARQPDDECGFTLRPCEPVLCDPATDCGPDFFCDYPDDACGGGAAGTCLPRPEVCPQQALEVCACDGAFYPSLCAAQQQGVDASSGPCPGPPPCSDLDCGAAPPIDESDLCPDGTPRPYVCDRGPDRVCGWIPADCPIPVDCVEASQDPILVGGGNTFGKCATGCVLRLRLDAALAPAGCDTAALEVCDADIAGAACTRHPGTLTPTSHARIRTLAAALVGVELQEQYGCPDCADGGASSVLLRRGGVESKHTYETGNPPAELAALDALVQGLLGDLARCESTDRVTVFPGCEPRP